MRTADNDWNDWAYHFAVAMRAANRSPRTIKLYQHYLSRLARCVDSPADVSLADLQQLLAREVWAAETRKSARTAFRRFFAWAVASGRLEASPAAALEAVRVPSGAPRPAPEPMVRILLANVDLRIRFMALLAATLGMRVGEIARVHERDYSDGRLRIHGKGGAERTAFVCNSELVALLENVRGWAFEGRPGCAVSSDHVSRLISRALPDGWTAHNLRHRAATIGLDATGNIYAVSKMLGHSRVETTQRYAQIRDDAVLAVFQAAA